MPRRRDAARSEPARGTPRGHASRRPAGGSPALPRAATLLGAVFLAGLAASPALADTLHASVERTVAPGDRALVRVRSDVVGPVTLLAYRVEEPLALLDAGVDLTRGEELARRLGPSIARARSAAPPRPTARRDPPPPADPVDARLSFVGSATAAVTAANTPVDVDVALPAPGLYLVEVRGEKTSAVVAALSSRLALVVKRHPEGCLAWAVDRTTGRPVQNVAVEARAAGAPVAAATTDERGVASLAFRRVGRTEVRGLLGDDLAFGEETYVPATVEDRRVYAFPHQPAYRPGERVEVKGVVRAFRDGRHALDPSVREVTVRFVGAGEREVGRVVAPVSADLGTFAAGLDLQKDAPTGAAAIVVSVGSGPGERSYEAPFRIEDYRRPTFEVKAAASAPRALVGEEVAFDVSAAYFEGGPVASATLSWSLVFQRVDRDLFPTDELVRLFYGAEREAYAPVVVAQGAGTLDAAGRTRVVARAPAVTEEGHLVLQATVTGPDRTAMSGSGSLSLLLSPVVVAIRADRHLYGAEGVARVVVRATLADGSPAAARAGIVTAALSVRGPEGLPEERDPRTLPFTTGPDGTAALDVPFSENGRWALSVAVPRLPSEPPGAPAHATIHVWVAGERADVGFSGDRVEIVADKDAYAPGEVARLLVLSPVGARPTLVTGEGAALLSTRVVDLRGSVAAPASGSAIEDAGAAALVEVAITDDHAPNVFVGACVVDRGNLLAATRMLRVPPAARRLRVEVVPEKADVEPGAVVPIAVRVADAAGKPVAGVEVALAVVDDALYALYADPAAPIEAFFHPVRRNDVRTGGPIHLASVGFERVAVRTAKEAAETEGGAAAPGAPAPSPRPPPAERPALGALARGGDAGPAGSKKDAGGEGPLPARADFRSSVAWFPSVRTGDDGTARVGPVRLADSLTRWRVVARAVDARTRVGSAETTVRASRNLLTRFTLPRFLRANDRVRAPWVSRNLTDAPADVEAVAMATGILIEGPHRTSERLAPGATSVHELALHAPRTGAATVTAELRAAAGVDAVRQGLPVLPQGVDKAVSVQGVVPSAGGSLPSLSLPPGAERGTARLRVSVAPSVAHAAGAALPYLAGYPYGCTEQTMSRFYPAAVARRALERSKAAPRGLLAEVPAMVDAGLARLAVLQHEDGSFGWWERDAGDPGMTAYVLHGLATAGVGEGAGAGLRDRAAAWLAGRVAAARGGEAPAAWDAETYALACLALAESGKLPDGALEGAAPLEAGGASAVARALLVRAGRLAGQPASDADAHVRDVLARAARGPDGVHWAARGEGRPTRWVEDDVEATAWVLWALGDDLPADLLDGGTAWLLASRTGDRWRSTRDTATCVAFLVEQASRASAGAGRPAVSVSMNGLPLATLEFPAEDVFGTTGVLEVVEAELPKGPVRISFAPRAGAVWASATLTFSETGPAVAASANGFTVRRRWVRLEAKTTPEGVVHVPVPWTETVPAGTLVESEVEVTSPSDREFVIVVDPHVAGFEPEPDVAVSVEGRAPAPEADHVDRRDDRTAFFVRAFPAGTRVFRHRMRATHVGEFTAVPASAELMYFPDVRGTSAGEAVEVSAQGSAGAAPGGR